MKSELARLAQAQRRWVEACALVGWVPQPMVAFLGSGLSHLQPFIKGQGCLMLLGLSKMPGEPFGASITIALQLGRRAGSLWSLGETQARVSQGNIGKTPTQPTALNATSPCPYSPSPSSSCSTPDRGHTLMFPYSSLIPSGRTFSFLHTGNSY